MHLPVWAWGVFGGAGLYLLVHLYKARQMSAQQAASPTAATPGAASTSGQLNSIFFMPNGPQSAPTPTQVGVNFNPRQPSSYQQIGKTYVTPSAMYSSAIEMANYHSDPNDAASIAIDSQAIIAANPQLDWTRAIPKGTSVKIPLGIGTQG